MIPFRKGPADYWARIKVLVDANAVTPPAIANKTPIAILDEDLIYELSFCFFAAWILKGALGKRLHLSFVALPRPGTVVMVLSENHSPYVAPKGGESLLMDRDYFTCPLDLNGGAEPAGVVRLLCPVLNKLRYNLSAAATRDGLEAPRKSQECCGSRKDLLWEYLERTVVKDSDRYGATLGGAVIPLSISSAIFEQYATNISIESGDLGKLLDETLLWFAMRKSGCLMGLPHAELEEPFVSNEIDFLLYETAGEKQHKAAPAAGWSSVTSRQRLTLFETTVGHRDEAQDGAAPGKDHPKNKLMNFLAFRSLNFERLRFHYLSILPAKDPDRATATALKSTVDFEYWSLSDEVPSVEQDLLNYFDSPVPIARLREWHRRYVEKVEEAALGHSLPG